MTIFFINFLFFLEWFFNFKGNIWHNHNSPKNNNNNKFNIQNNGTTWLTHFQRPSYNLQILFFYVQFSVTPDWQSVSQSVSHNIHHRCRVPFSTHHHPLLPLKKICHFFTWDKLSSVVVVHPSSDYHSILFFIFLKFFLKKLDTIWLPLNFIF